MISIAIMAHVARQDQAHRLARKLGGRLFLDSGALGEVENARRCWSWAATQPTPWVAIVQDDAVPVPDMPRILAEGIGHLPIPGLISCYLGTSYPTQHQTRVRRATQLAEQLHASWIESRWLLHGVAVAAPTRNAADIAATLGNRDRVNVKLPYDEQVSHWAQTTGMVVWYPWPSLVDHADGPTLIDHPDGHGREKPRHAWRTGAPDWNNRTVRL